MNKQYPQLEPEDHREQCTTISATVKMKQKPFVQAENGSAPQQTFRQRIFSWRSLIILLLHGAYMISNIPLVTISISLLCMCGPIQAPTNWTSPHNVSDANVSIYEDFNNTETRAMLQGKRYEFNWDPELRGALTSAYSFVVFLVPSVADVVRGYIGNKLTLTLATLALATMHFVAPIAARTSAYTMLAVRIVTSLTINAQSPVVGDTMAWWVPVQEKLSSVTFVFSGLVLAGIIFPMISGYLCSVPVDNGWPLIFYFQGCFFVVWTVLWHFLSSRKPETHPFISQSERDYIIANRVGVNASSAKASEGTPYRTILTSRPVWAFLMAHSALYWGILVVIVCLPLYLTSVLKFSVQEAGAIVSVMSALRFVSMFVWSAVGNWLAGFESMNTNRVRKICFCSSSAMGSVLYLTSSFFDVDHKWAAVVLIISGTVLSTFGLIVAGIIPLDLAPRYAGFISALCGTEASITSITPPIVVAALTTQGLYEEWRVVWIITALAFAMSSAIFLVFGSASLQPWAVATKEKHVSSDNEEAPLNKKKPKIVKI